MSDTELEKCFLCGSVVDANNDERLSNGLRCHAFCATALDKRFKEYKSLRHLDRDARSVKLGALAESICETHFTKLGYAVDRFGIENIATAYLSMYSEDGEGYYLESGFNSILRGFPDFLVSYKYTDGDHKGRRDAIFVDAKFRSDFDLDSEKETSRMIETYDHLLALGAPIMLYLVTPLPKGQAAWRDSHIYFNYFKFVKGRRAFGRWRSATDPQLDKWAIYKIANPRLFSETTKNVIEPLLAEELKKING